MSFVCVCVFECLRAQFAFIYNNIKHISDPAIRIPTKLRVRSFNQIRSNSIELGFLNPTV